METCCFVYTTVRSWSHSWAVPSKGVVRDGKTWAVRAAVGRLPMVMLPEAEDFSWEPFGREIVIG